MSTAFRTLQILVLACLPLYVMAGTPAHSVKFKLFGNKIFFTAYILDSQKIEVLFDPGAYAYLHAGTAQKYHIEYTETGKMASMNGAKETNMFTKFPVLFDGLIDTFETIRSQATAPYLEKRVDMVFGKEWADKYVVYIDYQSSQIHLYETGNFNVPDGFLPIKTVSWHRYPVVRSWFVMENGDSAELRVELNVGSEVGFQLDKFATNEYKMDKIQTDKGFMRVYGSDGKGLEGILTYMPAIQIGQMRQTRVRGGYFKEGYSSGDGEFVHGMVGMEFLKWYELVLDRWSGTVYYRPKAQE
jgi:hypothetical protein